MKSLQAFIHQEIPITQHMGIQLLNFDNNGLTIGAPLTPNMNDKQTAFAGSMSAVLTLAGWALTMLILKEAKLKADIAIANSNIDYLKPVTYAIEATSPMPDAESVQQFIETLRSHKRARWSLASTITEPNTENVAVQFSGSYVAFLK